LELSFNNNTIFQIWTVPKYLVTVFSKGTPPLEGALTIHLRNIGALAPLDSTEYLNEF